MTTETETAIRTYEEFKAGMEERPERWTPLGWMAANIDRFVGPYSEWAVRWLQEHRTAHAGETLTRVTLQHNRKTLLKALERAWEQQPYLRLGQLIVNVAGTPDPFYVEDATLLRQLLQEVDDDG